MEQVTAAGGVVTLVHLTYNVSAVLGDTDWRIACVPNMTELHQTVHHPNCQRTNDMRAVTCPICKKSPMFTELWQRLEAALRGPISVKT